MRLAVLNSVLKVLLVEDNPGDVRLFQESLREIAALQFELTRIDTLSAALECVATHTFDVGLLDLGLPDAHGLEVVRRVHATAPDLPLVVLSALKDERLAIQSLHEGAQDYLVKGELASHLLWRAIRYAMERQHLHLELRNLSLVDDLTGLSNRKGFLNLANHHISLANRSGSPFLVGFIDLDGMKQINDTFGHQEGNRALVETAGILRDSFRQSDILARFGGDEFAVVVTDAAESSIPTVAERIQQKLESHNAQPDRPYHLSLSIGLVGGHGVEPLDVEQLLQRADMLMYREKQDKRAARDCSADDGLDAILRSR